MLQRCCQPPLDVQHHPLLVGVGLHRLDDKIMRNVVEKPGDVTVQHPRVCETTLPACGNRVQRRAARPIPIGARVEPRLHHLLQLPGYHRLRNPVRHGRHPEHPRPPAVRFWYLHRPHRRWKIRPRGHPIPRHIQPVSKIGLELLDRAPIHPRCALVGFYLLERFHHRLLGDHKRLVCRLRLVHTTPPDHWPVDHTNLPWRAVPLAPPSLPGLPSYYKTVRQRVQQRYSTPCGFRRLERSLSPGQPAPSHVRTRLPTFPTRAADRVHAASMPDTVWPIHGHPPDSSRILEPNPVLMSSLKSRHVNSRSSPRSPPDASRAPFPPRSPRRSSANAAGGGLRPSPIEQSRRASILHLLSSTASIGRPLPITFSQHSLRTFHSLYRLFFRSASKSSIEHSSTPGAPLLALTFSHACQTSAFEISNGLPDDFSSLTRLLPGSAPRLIEQTRHECPDPFAPPPPRQAGVSSLLC